MPGKKTYIKKLFTANLCEEILHEKLYDTPLTNRRDYDIIITFQTGSPIYTKQVQNIPLEIV